MLKVGFSESTMFKEARPLWGQFKPLTRFERGIRQGLRLQSKRHRDSPVQESSFRSFPVQDYPYAEEHYVRQPDRKHGVYTRFYGKSGAHKRA